VAGISEQYVPQSGTPAGKAWASLVARSTWLAVSNIWARRRIANGRVGSEEFDHRFCPRSTMIKLTQRAYVEGNDMSELTR
jgi:hypothetical protein